MRKLKVQLIGDRSQFEVSGTLKRPCRRGETTEWYLGVNRVEGSPDVDAKIALTIPGPADPATDFSTPEFYLEGKKIDIRTHRFKVPTDQPLSLQVKVYVLPTAKWFPELMLDVWVLAADE